MSKKQPNIRWRQKDVDLLNKTLKNFNAKVARHENKGVSHLPDKIKKQEALEKIMTRKDFNSYIEHLQRFSVRGAENAVELDKGEKVTRWEYKEFKRREQQKERYKAKRLKELGEKEVLQSGEGTGIKRKEMGRIKENEVKPTPPVDTSKLKREDFQKKMQAMERYMLDSANEKKKQQAKNNYLLAMEREGFSNELIDFVKNEIDVDTFVDTIDVDETATFEFVYDRIQREMREEALRNSWEKAKEKQDKKQQSQ